MKTIKEIENEIKEYLIIYKDNEKAVKFLTLFLDVVINAPVELEEAFKKDSERLLKREKNNV